MIHLIWTKDNNTTTSEDGKEIKGVRQKLLECYKSLYFEEVEGLDPRSQIKRIAKNLVESVSMSVKIRKHLLTSWWQAYILRYPG